jgi:nucleoside-diphosphate-sugar epimerase
MPTRKLLITGAAGRIGRSLTRDLREPYALTLTDIKPPTETFGLPFTLANLADLDAVRALCQGQDTIIHMGADPRMDADWESLLPNNVIGTYNVFQAAHEAHCRRVIFASSINAVFGYPEDVQVHMTHPIRPINVYGATKVWGEGLASAYSIQHGLSCLCLRFGGVLSHAECAKLSPQSDFLSLVLTLDDLTRLMVASIEAPDTLKYGVFHGLSNNRWKRLDLTEPRTVLGYAPQDDAFALATGTALMPG